MIDFTGVDETISETILLVGLNGCGKSTLLGLIADTVKASMGCMGGVREPEKIIQVEATKEIKARLFEAEKDTKRGANYFDWDDKDLGIGFLMGAMRSSHGEAVLNGLGQILLKTDEYNTFLLDEPDQAASIRVAAGLSRVLHNVPIKYPGTQVIAAVHHPIIMEDLVVVYDLVARKFRKAGDFIKEMRDVSQDLTYKRKEDE